MYRARTITCQRKVVFFVAFVHKVLHKPERRMSKIEQQHH